MGNIGLGNDVGIPISSGNLGKLLDRNPCKILIFVLFLKFLNFDFSFFSGFQLQYYHTDLLYPYRSLKHSN